ncbi:MAG TPA: tetratricopeptide repeat protein [Bryobacteraceae bacterium]|nr:tetratricopeptide repeat protein [Bryobacteraceae bacterium]
MKLVQILLLCLQVPGDPAYSVLTQAFDALRGRDYDTAVVLFGKASALSPSRADIHKNLAYTLLKTGESDLAREQFGEAMRLDPSDLHLALEYAFLCYEAREDAPARKAEARRIFARIRDLSGADAVIRATAAQAFQNIDAPLAAGIARWQKVLAGSAPSFSAHYELAQLAEQRDELDLAAANYTAAFRLLLARKSVLLELARVEKTRGNPEGAMAALIAASRGGEPRAAELAREQLLIQSGSRYPYVYEFRAALALDPKSSELHRELAYLLLSMSEADPSLRADAEREFKTIVESTPEDYLAAAQLGLLYLASQPDLAMPLLNGVLAHGDAATANRVRMALKMPLVLQNRAAPDAQLDPRLLGERSFQAGFLKDAKRYFLVAREQNPVDASLALKLGWTNNMLHNDERALQWFDAARRSADPAIASEAARAYGNLRPGVELFRTTLWLNPMYSSRWNDVFGYGQVKTEVRIKPQKIHPYASLRFVGDARHSTGGVSPQNLSENAFILGVGVASSTWRGATAWFEAGEMFGYLHLTHNQDYRGGISYARTVGASLGAERGGWFFETVDDEVFVSHFLNDLMTYSQNKAGYAAESGGVKMQTFWSSNITFDVKRQYWANFAETGPGFRFRLPGMPASMSVTLNAVRGAYLVNRGNPRGPNFNDFRAGVWYAFTK